MPIPLAIRNHLYKSLATITVFINAALLFALQPMIAKAIIPYFGGTSSVWSTCLIFFQGSLLLGYSTAHLMTLPKRFRLFGWITIIVLLISSCATNFGILPESFQADQISTNPVSHLLITLICACGVQAFLLSMGSPFQQALYARTICDKDPYSLYSASNLGSLFGLLVYPIILEPTFSLSFQAILWFWIYRILALLCVLTWLIGSKDEEVSTHSELSINSEPFNYLWLIIPALSSSLLVSVTAYISTDIAPIPLLWVIPFALFLLSYIIAFSNSSLSQNIIVQIIAKIFTALAILCWISEVREPLLLLAPVYLISFVSLCFIGHRRLYDLRPRAKNLTRFYFYTSLGGFIGGLFASIVAPILFVRTVEIPLMTALLLSFSGRSGTFHTKSLASLSIICGAISTFIVYYLHSHQILSAPATAVWAAPILVSYFLFKNIRSLGYTLFLTALTIILIQTQLRDLLFEGRNFFGHLSVQEDSQGLRTLSHGITIHGSQLQSTSQGCHPTAYYHPTGPAGSALRRAQSITTIKTIGIIGLGTGALSCFATKDQSLEYYEINPMVIEIAKNPLLFTYLKNSPAKSITTVVGDARLSMKQIADAHFDLLIIDAFSSDSIPVHLITKEAIQEYLRVLSPTGALLFHISNKYLDIEPILSGAAQALKLDGRVWYDQAASKNSLLEGKLVSSWGVLSPSQTTIDELTQRGSWQDLNPIQSILWTDEFSGLLPILHLR